MLKDFDLWNEQKKNIELVDTAYVKDDNSGSVKSEKISDQKYQNLHHICDLYS